MIYPLIQSDISSVASIHRKELPGFLSKLGEDFLKEFYKTSLSIPVFFTFVYKRDGKITGFATGVETTEGLLKKMITKNPRGIGGALLLAFIRRPYLIREVIKTLRYPGFAYVGPELLSIAVDSKFQRKGTGREMFQSVAREFSRRKVKSFKISIYDGMSANDFYKKMGCTFENSFRFMGKKMNYYEFKISR